MGVLGMLGSCNILDGRLVEVCVRCLDSEVNGIALYRSAGIERLMASMSMLNI